MPPGVQQITYLSWRGTIGEHKAQLNGFLHNSAIPFLLSRLYFALFFVVINICHLLNFILVNYQISFVPLKYYFVLFLGEQTTLINVSKTKMSEQRGFILLTCYLLRCGIFVLNNAKSLRKTTSKLYMACIESLGLFFFFLYKTYNYFLAIE